MKRKGLHDGGKCKGCGSFNGQRRLSGKLFLALTCLGCEDFCWVCVDAGRHDQVQCLGLVDARRRLELGL